MGERGSKTEYEVGCFTNPTVATAWMTERGLRGFMLSNSHAAPGHSSGFQYLWIIMERPPQEETPE